MSGPGLFISFEGNDGSGKSTQLKLLSRRLQDEGYVVTENAEPGGTSIGQQIRGILLDGSNNEMAPMTELLLMFASRAQAAEQRILPALGRGEIVLSDRFTDSSLAYQGEARSLGFETVRRLHHLVIGDLWPLLTIYVEIDLEDSIGRARQRNRVSDSTGANECRLDDQLLSFHAKVRRGYQRIADEEPGRFRVIDGSGEPAVVAERIWNEVFPLLLNKAGQPDSAALLRSSPSSITK